MVATRQLKIDKTAKLHSLVTGCEDVKRPAKKLARIKDDFLNVLGFSLEEKQTTRYHAQYYVTFNKPDDLSLTVISETLRSYLNAIKSINKKHHIVGGKYCAVSYITKFLADKVDPDLVDALTPDKDLKTLRKAVVAIKKRHKFSPKIMDSLKGIKIENQGTLYIAPCYALIRRMVNEQLQQSLKKKLSHVMNVNPDYVLTWATDILTRKDSHYISLALALMAVTGRRSTEIMKTAIFHPSEKQNHVLFKGQLKQKEQERLNNNGYDIPVLVSPSLVITGLRKLRLKVNPLPMTFQGVDGQWLASTVGDKHYKMSIEHNKGINLQFATELTLQVKRDFNCAEMKPSLLRAAYTEIGFDDYREQGEVRSSYRVRVLGHSDLSSQMNYEAFRLSTATKKAEPELKNKHDRLDVNSKISNDILVRALKALTKRVQRNKRAKAAHQIHTWVINQLEEYNLIQSQLTPSFLRSQIINGKTLGVSSIKTWFTMVEEVLKNAAERLEAQRLAAERLAAERLAAERLAAERSRR